MAKISEYGLIGDGRAAALVSREGSLDWCCLPRFDSPSCFGALLDGEKGGSFSIRPSVPFRSEQFYLHDTNILEIRFEAGGSRARLLDAFAATSEADKRGRFWPDHEVLRVLEGLGGEIPFRVEYAPRPWYGDPARVSRLVSRGKFGLALEHGDNLLLLRSSLPPERWRTSGGRSAAEFTLRAGERVVFSLVSADEAPAVVPPLGPPALARLDETVAYWQGWMARCGYAGPYAEQVRRGALALKLLVFAPSGAILAAPTTSLPEALGGIRNWDYRYCWLRDAAFTVRALLSLGFREEAGAFGAWLLHSTRLTHPRLQALYTVTGEARLREKALPWLEGFAGSRPVRVGNAAAGQFQLDVYGEILDAVSHCDPGPAELDAESRSFLWGLGETICELWDRPDHGIWEVRSGPAQHTHSKVMAWAGLDRLLRLARREGWAAPLARWSIAMEKIREAIEARGYNQVLGSYTRTLDGNDLDASLLVMPLVGYCAADSPRMRSTLEAVVRRLSEGGLLYRYRADDGLPAREGCFGICNFWLAEALARGGRPAEARRWVDAVLARANGTGLWSEEIDPRTGEFLGNYPQGFTHIGLINAAIAIGKAEERRLEAAA